MSKFRQSATITIAAPPETIFEYLADPKKHVLIDGSGSLEGAVSGPERLELGSKFGMDMKRGPDIPNKVVEFEENRLIAWRHVAPHRWRYELTDTPEGTRVTETWDASYHNGFARIVLGLLGFPKRSKRAIDETLKQLKKVAEASVASTGTASANNSAENSEPTDVDYS